MAAVALACSLLGASAGEADDIAVYQHGWAGSKSYVHVLLDQGDSERDRAVCTYGESCAPPFMSGAAYAHLDARYTDGDAVTAAGIFNAVLAAVLENPLVDDVYLSLLISNHQDNNGNTLTEAVDQDRGGGAVLAGYKRIGDSRDELITTLASLPVLSAETSHSLQPRESYFEWLRYIDGGAVALGTNTSGNFGQSVPVPDYDSTIIADGRYLAPFADPGECPRLRSILFTSGAIDDDVDLSAEIAAQTPLARDVSFEQMLAYMHNENTDLLPALKHRVALQKTWVVSSRGEEGEARHYARAGGSGSVWYVDEPVDLERQLTEALLGVTPASRSFTPAAFAADEFRQGQSLGNLFVPLFQPAGGINWPGNLKKLKLLDASAGGGLGGPPGRETVVNAIVDARGDPGFELSGSNRGRIRFDALTYWTDPGTLPPGDGVVVPENADGRAVARGGAGQKIDGLVSYGGAAGGTVQYFIGDTNADTPVAGYPPRQLFYEPEFAGDFKAFDANAVTLQDVQALLDPRGELTGEQVLELIRWGRGQDIDNGSAAARHWLLGAILHSRPVALNYGATPGYSASNPNIRLLLGSGDGLFRIIENTDAAGNETGREVFAFYPRELLGNIRLYRENSLPAQRMPYGADGVPVALALDRNGDGTLDHSAGDKAYVYFGLRRGGYSYYALDVSNPAATPSLAWKISRTTGGSFDELGLTFSTPVVGKVNYAGTALDVLVFAGGYDGGWNPGYTSRRGKDLDASDDTAGNAVYIVNARSGELVWKAVQGATGSSSNTHYEHAGLVDSIPSAVAALQSPGGYIHRLYVADSGGAVWRVDLPPAAGDAGDHRKENWFITKLADLGSDAAEAGGTSANDLRFFHAPEVIRTFDAAGALDGVLLQSGDRANPNDTVVEDHLFYIKDRETLTGSTVVRAENESANPRGRYVFTDLLDQTACIAGTESLATAGETIACREQAVPKGWKINYQRPGEKGLSTPLTDAGRVFATTFTPGDSGACPPQEGQGHVYVVQLEDGTAVANNQRIYDIGAGVPAAPVQVGSAILVPGGGIDLYDLDGDGTRDTSKLLPSQAETLYRIYWREPGIDPL